MRLWKGIIFLTIFVSIQSCSYPVYFPQDEDLVVVDKKSQYAIATTSFLSSSHLFYQLAGAYSPIDHLAIQANYTISQKSWKYNLGLGYYGKSLIEGDTYFYYGIDGGAGSGYTSGIFSEYNLFNNGNAEVTANYFKYIGKIGLKSKYIDIIYGFRTSFHDIKTIDLMGEFSQKDVEEMLAFDTKPLFENTYRLSVKNKHVHFFAGISQILNKGISQNQYYSGVSMYGGIQLNLHNL